MFVCLHAGDANSTQMSLYLLCLSMQGEMQGFLYIKYAVSQKVNITTCILFCTRDLFYDLSAWFCIFCTSSSFSPFSHQSRVGFHFWTDCITTPMELSTQSLHYHTSFNQLCRCLSIFASHSVFCMLGVLRRI